MTRSDGALSLALLGGGFILWSAAFVTLYATLSIGCQFGWELISVGPTSLLRTILAAIWTTHLLAHVFALAWTRRWFGEFKPARRTKWRPLLRMGIGLHVAATLSTGLLAIPIVGASSCI